MKKDIYKKIAKEVINTEIVSLNRLKNSLDSNFKKVVEKILECKKGKIILSGVGKSGIIAKNFLYIGICWYSILFCGCKFLFSWRLGAN